MTGSTHLERIVTWLERVADLDENAAAWNAMGVPVAQAIHQLALSIREEEQRVGDGCLRRLERYGTLPPMLPRAGAAVGVTGGDSGRAALRGLRRR